jgi:hypothetical protein
MVIPAQAASGLQENLSNTSINQIGNYPIVPEEKNYTAPIPQNGGQVFDEYDAGTDMVSNGVWVKGPTVAADGIYDAFGLTRGFIFSLVGYNINPEKIPIAKDYNDQNQNMAVILAVIFIIGESLASSAAASNYPAYRNVFGEKDFSQKKYVGGGIAMIAGISAAWIFRGIMILIDLINAYMMIQIMDAIKPSLDNGIMYLAMCIIELILAIFFLYRQVLIGAMYIASPIYGVMWASGYMKEFIDSIGDKFVRALIMQPLCIFVTCVAIVIMKAMEWSVLGITVFEGDDELLMYVFLLIILVYTCVWCLFGKMTIVKRTLNLVIFKKVGI